MVKAIESVGSSSGSTAFDVVVADCGVGRGSPPTAAAAAASGGAAPPGHRGMATQAAPTPAACTAAPPPVLRSASRLGDRRSAGHLRCKHAWCYKLAMFSEPYENILVPCQSMTQSLDCIRAKQVV